MYNDESPESYHDAVTEEMDTGIESPLHDDEDAGEMIPESQVETPEEVAMRESNLQRQREHAEAELESAFHERSENISRANERAQESNDRIEANNNKPVSKLKAFIGRWVYGQKDVE